MKWTVEQIMALAPDAASAKAGQGLAAARKWSLLGRAEPAVWGHCQGSGKDPYRTQIDLNEPAFRCTCPSRKFPCKHGLGLLLLLANQPQLFTAGSPPPEVSEWIESRAERTERRAHKQAAADERPEAVADPAAQAKRAADREARVKAGLQELNTWLRDLVRAGLATAQTQPRQFWERPAARLVDAQAPGLARMVRELASIPSSGDGWQERLLERIGKIYLLIEGSQRIGELPAETQADLRSFIGWTQSQDELLKTDGVHDRWSVLGQRVEEEDRLRVQRTWLWGESSRRAAVLIHFAAGNQPLDASVTAGTVLDGELVFFPGAYPLRALIKDRADSLSPLEGMPGYADLVEATAAYAAALARNPWIEIFPMALKAVVPVRGGEQWLIRDAEGSLLRLSPRFAHHWSLLALSGGREIELFGEWDGDYLRPLSLMAEGRFVRFNS
ncbi:MAG TPA: SWIM zinc finger family protein [Blastocatellia bacterium]|nr:SWIM zinc finger family protein [Blastocatellia bacterium]